MNNTCYYQLILDASGSMADGYDQTLSSLNEQLLMIRSLATKHSDQKILMGLNDFSYDIRTIWPMTDPNSLQNLHEHDYQLRGNTALWDAIGATVSKLNAQIGDEVSQDQASVVVMILTDGYENASRYYTASTIRALMKDLKAKGNWEFRFIGADIDVENMADSIGLDRKFAYQVSKSDMMEASVLMADEVDAHILQKKAMIAKHRRTK